MAFRKPGSYPDDMAIVCNLEGLANSDLDAIFSTTQVDEVWGVGRRLGKQLQDVGVKTVLDLARLSPAMVRSRWGVVLERTVRELQGQACIELEDAPAAKQQIACTRSFGHPVTELEDLIEAVSDFASRAAEKLRRQSGFAGQILVFAHSSPFRPGPRFYESVVVPLRRPTADSQHIVQAAVAGVRQIYKPGFRLSKAGVMLLDLVQGDVTQGELDLDFDECRDRTKLMVAMDALNTRFGRGIVHVGSASRRIEKSDWKMRQERLTPQYTTKWDHVPVARA